MRKYLVPLLTVGGVVVLAIVAVRVANRNLANRNIILIPPKDDTPVELEPAPKPADETNEPPLPATHFPEEFSSETLGRCNKERCYERNWVKSIVNGVVQCPHCGFEEKDSDQSKCAKCGVVWSSSMAVQIIER